MKSMMNKMIMAAAVIALATGLQAETLTAEDLEAINTWTPEHDLIASQAEFDAATAEVQAANKAIAIKGFSAYGQMYVAIAHAKKVIDAQKAIIRRGEKLCSLDESYAKAKGAFWRDLAFAVRDYEQDLNNMLAEMQQKANKMISASEGEFGRIA